MTNTTDSLGSLWRKKFDDLNKPNPEAIKTPFPLADKALCGGFLPKCTYLLAGHAKSGKTTLATFIAGHVINNEKRVLYISTELSSKTIQQYVLSGLGFKDGEVDKQDYFAELVNEKLFVIDSSEGSPLVDDNLMLSADRILKAIGDEATMWRPDLVIFDNVSPLRNNGQADSWRQEQAFLNRLITLTKKHKFATLAITHLKETSVTADMNRQVNSEEVVTAEDAEKVLTFTKKMYPKPTIADIYGGSATSLFDAILILWRPYIEDPDSSIASMCALEVPQTRWGERTNCRINADMVNKRFYDPLSVKDDVYTQQAIDIFTN